MRFLIHLAFVLLICFVGIGLYRGWFSFSSPSPDAENDKVNMNLSLDKAKMKSDAAKVKEKIAEKVDQYRKERQEKAAAQPTPPLK